MKTVKMESPKLPAQRGSRRWLIRIALLLGLPFLLYYGYCWGWWGQGSLLLQYLIQCGCPTVSNEARYPEQIDIVVSACRYKSARLLPSGRFLYIEEKRFLTSSTFLIDLHTKERIAFKHPGGPFYFLTDSLVYVSSSEEHILDWANEKQYPIQKFVYSRPDAYVNGNANLRLLAEALYGAKYVFLINDIDTVVALASDFLVNPDHNFTTDRFDIPGFSTDRMEQFLQENSIVYQSIPANFPGEAVSPDGRFIALHDGIYLIETNQKIVDAYPSRLRGWIYDSRRVIYSSDGPCLIQTNFGILDDSACFFQVPQPVLLLKVPEEYLTPTQTP